jgi:hypothetical protein
MKRSWVVSGIVFVLLVVGGFIAIRALQRDPLVGKWEPIAPDEMFGTDVPKEERPQWILTLNADGSFTEHMESHIMMNFVSDAKGAYKHQKDNLTLDGSSKVFTDDGYSKGTETVPVHRTFRVKGDKLIENGEEKGEMGLNLIYARVGTPRETTPQPQKPKLTADPKAVDILKAVDKTYASLKTYSDQGTLEGSGEGFMYKHARFTTRFSRPNKFFFSVEGVENGKAYDRNAVWTDGKKEWLYMGMDGALGERDIRASLGTISPTSGIETTLIPDLLAITKHPEDSLVNQFGGIHLGSVETIGSIKCQKVKLQGETGQQLDIWVGLTNHLIYRAYDDSRKATITYHPKTNVRFGAHDFTFKVPRR